jgi:hypothetical protein
MEAGNAPKQLSQGENGRQKRSFRPNEYLPVAVIDAVRGGVD